MNPFSSRYIKPGAREYLFPAGEAIEELIERLGEKRMVQIVGPHGSGKSTLVEMIRKSIECNSSKIVIPSHRDKTDSLKEVELAIKNCSGDDLIVVDGIEQLKASRRNRIFAQCQKNNLMLLVTTHESVGIETLIRTETSFLLFKQMVNEMLQGQSDGSNLTDGVRSITDAEIEKVFKEYAPNIREALFALYDIFERRSQLT